MRIRPPRTAMLPRRQRTLGRVAAPRGLHGEMRIVLVDPDAREFLRAGELYMGEDHLCLRVRQARLFKGQGLLELEGIDDRDAAEFWRDARIYVPAVSVAPLDEGEYYYRQIVGLSVITEQGETLGHVTEILPTGANDVYVVQGANGEILLPAIKEVIREIDLHTGTVLVRLLDGLRD
jgi:16S rRNA processing protein RimM